jgi:GTP cyclohydrolase I
MAEARLVLTDVRQLSIPGLGSHRPFRKLSQKRITKAVREALRKEYGSENVEVSCSATHYQGIWKGTCRIGRTCYSYRLMAGLYS